MKKFFSLVCAVLLVFSASAAPVAQKAQLIKKAPVAVEQMQKVQFEKAQIANFNQLSATPALTVSNQKGKMAPIANKRLMANHQAVPAKPAVRKAANAVAEDINVTATSVYASDYYGYLDYYMYVEGGAYDFSGIAPVEGKTYTLADMDPDYTGWYSNEDEGYITTKATAATLTVSKKNGLPYVVGTMTIGDNNYTITYELVITDTVTVKAANLAVKSHYYGGYEYTFNDAAWTFDIVDFDMTSKTGTLTNIDFDYSCVYPTGGSSYDGIYFASVVEDVVVAQDADTLKLTGAVAAQNGILYVLDARYEKPAAKEITLVADTLNFFTKMLNAGYYQMQGYTVDSTYAFSFYFISKSLTGNFTEEDMDAYSTWVDQKDGKKTVVSYQNLSAANVTVSFANDTLYYTGTMTLATNDGQEAEVTLNLSCPYEQTWGEWADFAPFDLNTGKYSFSALDYSYTQRNIAVQYRTDNMGLKQYKLAKWGDGMFADPGTGKVDLVITMDGKYNCTITPTITDMSNYAITDYTTYTGQTDVASTYDPETATFKLAAVYFNPSTFQAYKAGYETFVMDQPITERDTVDIVSTALKYNNLIATNNVVIYYAADVPNYYLFRVTSNNATSVDGTFKWAEGGINNYNSYFSVSGTDKNYFQDGEFTVVANDKDIALTGWMIGEDEKYYRLDMSYTAPTERDTIDVISNKMTYNDFIATNAAVQYYAGDDAGYVQFCVTSKDASSVFGTFDVWADYSWINFTETTSIDIQEGQITVTEEEDGVHLTGYVIGDDEKYYRLNWFMAAGILPSDTDAPFEYEFAWENMQSTVKEGIVDIIAADGVRQMRLVLFVNSAATTIPAGTYVISDTQEEATALQSVGSSATGVTPCYAATLVNNGGKLYLDDLWFMVEGAVTIAEDGSIAVNAKNSYGQDVIINIQAPTPTVTDYYLVGWINNAAYGIEGDIDNFGDYHFVDGKVRATFDVTSYVQVKDNNKQIYGTDSYIAPAERGNETLVANGPEKIGINGGVEYEYTLVVNNDGTLTLSYEVVPTGLNDINAAVKATKVVRNGRMMVIKDAKVYSVLGQQIQ